MFHRYLTARQFSYSIAFNFVAVAERWRRIQMDHRPSKRRKQNLSGHGRGSGATLSRLDRLGQACFCMPALLMLGAVAWMGATGCGPSGGSPAAAATPTATASPSSAFTICSGQTYALCAWGLSALTVIQIDHDAGLAARGLLVLGVCDATQGTAGPCRRMRRCYMAPNLVGRWGCARQGLACH
jgi:hypothetical protein